MSGESTNSVICDLYIGNLIGETVLHVQRVLVRKEQVWPQIMLLPSAPLLLVGRIVNLQEKVPPLYVFPSRSSHAVWKVRLPVNYLIWTRTSYLKVGGVIDVGYVWTPATT